MKNGWFGVAVAVALTGCDGVRLDAFDETPPELTLSANPDGSSVSVTLRAHVPGDSCPTFSSAVRAELNGMPLQFDQRGGMHTEWGMPTHCVQPTFTLDASAERTRSALNAPATTFRMTDGERTWVAEVEFLCNPRSLRLLSPSDGVIRPGDRVEAELEPATDTFFFMPDGEGPHASLSLERGSFGYIPQDTEFEGNRLRFTAPPTQLEGPGVLRVSASRLPASRRHVSHCEGFERCTFDCGWGPGEVSTPVLLSPR
jgi:hypothetical protein